MGTELGKILIIAGMILAGIGFCLLFGIKLNFLGRLPGDIRIERENFSFYFPLGTCLLFSFLLSALLWFFRR